jgi:hypothetical protein
MMNSPVLERMKGRYRKGILELAQAGDAGRFGENFGKNFGADTEIEN